MSTLCPGGPSQRNEHPNGTRCEHGFYAGDCTNVLDGPLQAYVGRKFIIQKTRYGALDGHVGTVECVVRVPSAKGDMDVLSVSIPTAEFDRAIMLPKQFASEVK